MADMTRTVATSGADHTTIASAMAYIVSNFTYGTTDVATIQLVAAEEFNESNIVLGGVGGTESATTYLRIEADSGSRHDGTYNTGKARVRGNTNGQHVFQISDDYVHIRYLAIQQDSTGASDECIRLLDGLNDVLIEKSVIELDNGTDQQDCIHASHIDVTDIRIFDCVFKLNTGNRAAINGQAYSGASAKNQSYHIRHCTIDCDGAGWDNSASDPGAFEGGISGRADHASSVVTFNVDNTACFDAGNGALDYNTNVGSFNDGTVTWSGQGNVGSDTSCKTELGATNNLDSQTLSITDEVATEFLVTNLTGGSEDYQLVDGASSTDNSIDNAIDPGAGDSRVDLDLDIAGNARPGTYTDRDTGAFEVVAAAAGSIMNQLQGSNLGSDLYNGTIL